MSRTYYDFLHFFCNKGVNQNNLFQASSLLSRDRNQLRTDEVIGARVWGPVIGRLMKPIMRLIKLIKLSIRTGVEADD